MDGSRAIAEDVVRESKPRSEAPHCIVRNLTIGAAHQHGAVRNLLLQCAASRRSEERQRVRSVSHRTQVAKVVEAQTNVYREILRGLPVILHKGRSLQHQHARVKALRRAAILYVDDRAALT